jgi:hypothetical protein
MFIRLLKFAIVIGLLPLIAAGCKRTSSIGGNVTYDGQTVKKGSISFVPEDGKGPTHGSPIVQGAYRVDNITPGKKIVRIVSVKQTDMPQSTEDLAKRAKTNTGVFSINVMDEIPSNAVGNNISVEIGSGRQTIDFPLKKPNVK